jgi:hypothetical protein
MARPLLAAALLLVASAAAFSTSCNASTTESCLAGPCTGSGGAGSTSATASGSGGVGAAAACPPTPQVGDFPCDVFKIIHNRCNPCHQMPPLNGAPFPLLTYENTQEEYEPGILKFQQMYAQIQPGASPRMPFGGMLTASELTTMSSWLSQCAPPLAEGTGCECPGTGCD